MSRRPLTVPYEPDRRDKEGPWALALAYDVVEYDFGIFVKVVAECLNALGRPEIPQIAHWLAKRYPSESPALLAKKAKCALIVLLSHGCASASVVKKGTANGKPFSQTSGRLQQRFLAETAIVGAQSTSAAGGAGFAAALDGSGMGGFGSSLAYYSAAGGAGGSGSNEDADYGSVRYSFEVHRTLQRLRHPHFVYACSRTFHEAGAAIAQALLQNGPSRKGAILREAAHILARNRAGLSARLPHHQTLPDFEGGPGSGRSGPAEPGSSSDSSAGGAGGAGGSGSDSSSSSAAAAAQRRRQRARSNSSASSNTSAASHESASSAESGSGSSNSSSEYHQQNNDQTKDSAGGRLLTRDEFESAFTAVKSTWQRMVDAFYVVPAGGLSTFAFPRALRSATWLKDSSALSFIEEEDRTLKELSYWSASSATSSIDKAAGVSSSAGETGGMDGGPSGFAGGMGLLDAAARRAAEAEAGIDDDSDEDEDDDDGEDARPISGRKRSRKAAGSASASAASERAAKRRRKDEANSSDDTDDDSSSNSSDSDSSSSGSDSSSTSSSSSDDESSKGKGKGKKKLTVSKNKKAADTKSKAKGKTKKATATKAKAAGGSKKVRAETKAERIKKDIVALQHAASRAHVVLMEDEDNAVWSFGTEAANRFLRNDLIRKHAEACVQLLASTSALASSSSAASNSVESGRVASKALLALMYRSAASFESSTYHEGPNSILNERSQSVSVAEIVRTLKEEYKEAPVGGGAGGGAAGFGRMTPSAGQGGGSRSQSPSLSGVNEKSVYQALQNLAKHPTAPIVEDRKGAAASYSAFSSSFSSSSSSYGDRKFFVPYRSVLTFLQMTTIEEAIKEKNILFGPQITRLLLHKGALDEKQVSEAMMLPAREARTGIFGLVSKGYVDVQEIPKRPDRHPQFTFYLYAASFPKLLRVITEECHKAQLNLRRRAHMELARASAAVVAHDAGTLAFSPEVMAMGKEQALRIFVDQRSKMRQEQRRKELAASGVTALSDEVKKRHAAEETRAVERDTKEFLDDAEQSGERAITDFLVGRMEEAPERLMAAYLRLETTTLLLRDLHFRSVPRLTGFDMEWVETTIAKGGAAK